MVEDEVLFLVVHLVLEVLDQNHRRLCRLHVVLLHLNELVHEGISPPY